MKIWTAEEIEFAKNILKDAESVSEVCNKLGVTLDALKGAFRRRNLPHPKTFLESSEEDVVDLSEFDEEKQKLESTIRVFDIDKWHKDRNLSNRTHLVIPDAHAKPNTSNKRFEWLGKFIRDLQPDVVVCIGDFADMESLSSYDKGKKSFEGRRYKKDIDAAIDAQERIFKYANQSSKKPNYIMTLGNHDGGRISKVSESSPEFDGLISIDDLKYEEFGWNTYDFLDRVIVDGVCYSHYFTSGVMNRSIGGENAAATLIKKQFMSCTQGHSHLRDFAERTRADGTRMLGLVCGCYFEHDEDYASVANSLWWRGVVVKRYVQNGEYEPEFVPIEALRDRYDKDTT